MSTASIQPESTEDVAAVIDYCGEIYEVRADQEFLIGREADLCIDDNPYLHRRLVRISCHDGLWWLDNIGSRITGLAGTVTPEGVTFTWDAVGTGTTYLYHVEDPKEDHPVRQTKETTVTVPVVPGRTCLSVAVRNSDGRSSNEAIECVETP